MVSFSLENTTGFPVHHEGRGVLKIGHHGMGHELADMSPAAVNAKLATLVPGEEKR